MSKFFVAHTVNGSSLPNDVEREAREVTFGKISRLLTIAKKAEQLNPQKPENKEAVKTLEACERACIGTQPLNHSIETSKSNLKDVSGDRPDANPSVSASYRRG
ncbi:MAG: hypothetical protein H0U75_01370 [Legionella sp.]|nr:hypothetical protein [Legionella sp.]